PEAALIRELREELGIHAETRDLVAGPFASAQLGERHLLLLLFICRRWSGEPRALDAAALKWVRSSEMRALDMPPADGPLIPLLEALL
ncbi:MAG TPA: NUDIX domain-containing protein, partial [Allosphingosinicella sp.]|nr:NUDIX domain-containing protein [Allosphingosinicella sp.]